MQRGSIDAHEDLIPGGADAHRIVPQHLEVQRHGFRADVAHVRGHAKPIVEARRPIELTVHHRPGKPHVVPVEDIVVGEARRAEQLRLREFEEPQIGAVAKDAGEIYVRPTDVFFDNVRLGGQTPPRRDRRGEARRRRAVPPGYEERRPLPVRLAGPSVPRAQSVGLQPTP